MKREYQVIPKGAYPIIRNCQKCKQKRTFISTDQFRLNANGNKLDGWLIYQCEHCKHTYNLPIYERADKNCIPKEVYDGLINNDFSLVTEFGTNHSLLQKNKVGIELEEIEYEVIPAVYGENMESQSELCIHNPYGIRISLYKVLAALLGATSKEVRFWSKTELIHGKDGAKLGKYTAAKEIEIAFTRPEKTIVEEKKQEV